MAKLPDIIAAAPEVKDPSPGYFIGLGLVIADLKVREELEHHQAVPAQHVESMR